MADDRENNLDVLFNKLKDINSNTTFETEQKIWSIWSTHPSDQKLTKILGQGSELVLAQKYVEALEIFTKVINLDPSWAEA